MARVIGIDLGTTYSAAAILGDDGTPRILYNREGERLTPSVVLFQGGGMTLVGSQARRSAASSPDDVVQFVKRHMGDPDWVFATEDDERYRPEQVSAIILRRLVDDAAMQLDEPVTEAVITVPAYFDDARRTATRQAGEIAGLTVRHIVNEPTAAAVAHGLQGLGSGRVLVYDLGGGTFDVTLMRVDDGEFEVVATDGDRNLGGFDWDNALMEDVNNVVMQQGGPDLLDDPKLEAELRDKAEMAKHALTTMPQAKLFMTTNGANYKIAITRERFAKLTEDLLRRTEQLMQDVIDDAGVSYADIDQILLVGGSTRMPMVAEMISRVTGRRPTAPINPDESVALGAAAVAHVRGAGRPAEGVEPKLPITVADVTSHGLGVLAVDDDDRAINSIIIQRNTKIPSKREERYRTRIDQQTTIDLTITEGDDEDPTMVSTIHSEPIAIAPHPRHSPVSVTMSFDVDGIIHVEVFDLVDGVRIGEVELERPPNLGSGDVDELRQRTAALQID